MITNTKINELLSDLNDEQKKCVDVENLDGKFLVLAGPGTGKTHTVIRRLQAMILQGVKPERILCMTYSRAGADEMKKRVLKELDERNNNIEIHTFHGFCNKIITEYAEEFNLPAHIGLIPDGMQSVLVKALAGQTTDPDDRRVGQIDFHARNGGEFGTQFLDDLIHVFLAFVHGFQPDLDASAVAGGIAASAHAGGKV